MYRRGIFLTKSNIDVYKRLLAVTKSENFIEQQYSRNGQLLNDLLHSLEAISQNNTDKLELLSKADAFNSRGWKGRLDLVALLQNETKIQKHHHIIDIGCGIGGTARFLHKNYGCMVTGVDITKEYVNVGNYLIKMLIDDENRQVNLIHASACELPFPDCSIDIAWTEHVQMNIQEKSVFYKEIERVLVSGGKLAFHDVLVTHHGRNECLRYPCPWADSSERSFLVTETELRYKMKEVGLQISQWIDTTDQTIEFLERARNKSTTSTPSLGVHLLMGSNAPTKVQNHLDNLATGKTKMVMGVAVKS